MAQDQSGHFPKARKAWSKYDCLAHRRCASMGGGTKMNPPIKNHMAQPGFTIIPGCTKEAIKSRILECNAKQQRLDLSINLPQPLRHWTEYFEAHTAINSTLTSSGFLQLIKKNSEFFVDSVVNLRSGTFLTMSFPGRLNEWLHTKNPNNLIKSEQGDMK